MTPRVHEAPHSAPKIAKAAPVRRCINCGHEFHSGAPSATFCASACRFTFDNRRKQRGAILYDLFMATRYDRSRAKQLGLWSAMAKAASQWREEDARERAGRRSWQTPSAALSRLTHIFATILVRGRS